MKLRCPDSNDPKFFHAFGRGNDHRPICLDDGDRKAFLFHLGRSVRRHGWQCLAYCLMDNHFHLVVHTTPLALSRGLRDFKSGHAQGFHKAHGTTGHLFEPNPRPRVIRNEAYLFTTLAYVLWNPVDAGCCRDPGDWEWSSFRSTLQPGMKHDWFDPTAVLSIFREDLIAARTAFADFVRAGSPRRRS